MLFLIDELFGVHNFPFLAMFAPLFVMVANEMAALASMVWAPFGALICALIAWRRGLSPVAGAVYSALFFLPWVYLAARMLGRAVPKPLAVLPYVVLYAHGCKVRRSSVTMRGIGETTRRIPARCGYSRGSATCLRWRRPCC